MFSSKLKQLCFIWLVSICTSVVTSGRVQAVEGESSNYKLDFSSINNSSETAASSSYHINATVGETITGTAKSANYMLCSGYTAEGYGCLPATTGGGGSGGGGSSGGATSGGGYNPPVFQEPTTPETDIPLPIEPVIPEVNSPKPVEPANPIPKKTHTSLKTTSENNLNNLDAATLINEEHFDWDSVLWETSLIDNSQIGNRFYQSKCLGLADVEIYDLFLQSGPFAYQTPAIEDVIHSSSEPNQNSPIIFSLISITAILSVGLPLLLFKLKRKRKSSPR